MIPSLSLQRLCWTLLALLCLALSFKALREPDLWWMYRTGEWMLQNGQVTYADPFSFTFEGKDWINVKWLYEIIIALWAKLFGPEGAFVLQSLVATSLAYSLHRSSQSLAPNAQATSLAFFLLFLPAALSMEFRWIGRPEMSSHLFTSLYLLLFLREQQQAQERQIYWLIPLQILWTNLHEGFGTGMVLMIAFLSLRWLAHLLRLRYQLPSLAPKTLSLAVGLALLGVAIHPRGPAMWLHPLEIFGQLGANKYTTELLSISNPEYWQWEAYLSLGFATLSLTYLLLYAWKNLAIKGSFILAWEQRLGLPYLGLLALLFYLSLTAYRNIPFFIIAATPIGVQALRAFILRYLQAKAQKALLYLSLAAYASLYIGVVSGQYWKIKEARDTFGLQVLTGHNPIGAANFIKAQQLDKGRCFSDYLTSSYLLWAAQPHFKTYIDLRDLDIFSDEFFQQFLQMTFQPSLFEQQDSIHRFDYVVLFRPQFATLHRHILNSPRYDLVFADGVAVVYAKQQPSNEALIKQFGFKANGKKDLFSPLASCQSSPLAFGLTKLLNPLFQNEDYSSIDQDLIAGSFYQSIGEYALAVGRALRSAAGKVEPWRGSELLGNVYNNWAYDPVTPDSLRPLYQQQALQHYEQALQKNPKAISVLCGKATLLMQQQQFSQSLELLKRAYKIAPWDLQTNQLMAMNYKFLASTTTSDPRSALMLWAQYTERVLQLVPGNVLAQLDLGIAYCQLNNCPRAVELLRPVLNVPGLPAQEFKIGQDCLRRCGGK
jgi:tetratricopeptide (TPR) repeat protein